MKDEREYLFRAVSGEQIEMHCSVEFDAQQWVKANRELSDIERYGIAKIALLRALDDPEPPSPVRSIRPSETDLDDICRELDL